MINNVKANVKANDQAEGGYALVTLLLFMSLLALFAMAAAPNIKQQDQREREKEAIFRGQQVADAIYHYYRDYKQAQGVNALPTSIDQLLEGIPRGTKKIQILRPEAARDPLSHSGEWRLIGPTSENFTRFIAQLTTFTGGTPPPARQEFNSIANLIPRVTDVLSTGSTKTAPGGEDNSESASGPFLGVASRSQRNSVITFYGIDRHDQWIFTPVFR